MNFIVLTSVSFSSSLIIIAVEIIKVTVRNVVLILNGDVGEVGCVLDDDITVVVTLEETVIIALADPAVAPAPVEEVGGVAVGLRAAEDGVGGGEHRAGLLGRRQ